MINALVNLGSKLLDIIFKRSKDAKKQQDIEIKKIDVFSKALAFIFIGVFLMCVLASLVPSLAITPYWFNVFDKFINYLFTN